MSTDPVPFTPPKKKPSIFWWLGGLGILLLILFALFLVQLVGPSPRIVISKETTYITEPLLPGGMPNYEEYVRQKLREGVTPENNAAVLLFQALWPGELEPDQYEAVAAELGLEEVPSAKNAMQSVYGEANTKRVAAWLPKPNKSSDADSEAAPDTEPDASAVIDPALRHPWTSQQLPPLAEWVGENQKPLDLIVAASRRPRYYSPSPTLLNQEHDMLIAMLLPGTQSLRDGVRGLNVRAMQRIGENRFDEAWQDILAMYRLSALASQGSTLVEQLVAMAIRGMAFQATAALLSSDHLTKEQAHQIQQDLAAIPPFAVIANCVDHSERLSSLDAVVHMRLYGFSALSDMTGNKNERSPVDMASVNWNIVLEKLNKIYDKAAAAMRLPPGEERRQALAEYTNEIENEGSSVKRPARLIAALVSRNTRSDLIGSIITALMLPALEAATTAEDRTNANLALTQLAAAIAVYHAEHGAYPDTLDDLVPDVLAKLPTDPYSQQPFMYKRVDKGYLLYSFGANGRDDSGNNEQQSIFEGQSVEDFDQTPAAPEDAAQTEAEVLRGKIPSGADDFSIRLPVSAYELPKAALPTKPQPPGPMQPPEPPAPPTPAP